MTPLRFSMLPCSTMDANHVLLFLAVASAVSTIARAARMRTSARGWIAISLLILMAIGVAEMSEPKIAGYVGGALWLSLLLIPSLLWRRTLKLRLNRQFRRARSVANIARFLHPMDGWWNTPALLGALELADSGEEEAAIQILDRLSARPKPIGPQATVLLYSLRNQWGELIAWTGENTTAANIVSSGLFSFHLSALGETGDLSRMVATYERFAPALDAAAFVLLRRTCRQAVFAYCGRVSALMALLDDGRVPLSPEDRDFWIARAELAAGNRAAADARFESLQKVCSRATKRKIARVGETNPAPAADLLTPNAVISLDRIERAWLEECRYHGPTLSRARPVVTVLIAVAIVLVFAIECITGGSTDGATLYRLGGVYAPAVWAGQWWRLIASNFLHAGPIHVTMNLLGLIVLGPFVEWTLGWLKYLLLYLLSGVGSLLVVALLQRWNMTSTEMVVGASGAIMGLVGASGAILLRGWLGDRAPAAMRRLRTILLIVGIQVIFDASTPLVSSSAHIAGVLIGFAFALPFKSQITAGEGLKVTRS